MKSIEKRIARWCEVQTLTRPRCKFVYVMVAYLGGLRLLQPGGRHMQWTPPDQKLGALEVAVHTVIGPDSANVVNSHSADGVSGTEK